jgi:phage terminase small subunit|tara:strand:+ start:751 stop:1368 length:618 start_codon:yes stop_codon:yes gene_type:complete
MGVPKRLTDQQQRFSELYVYNEGRMTPYECAVEAGYAKDSARVRASELRNPRRFPLVVKYIGELREEVQNKYEVTFEKHIKELARLRDEALKKGSFSSAVNAEVARGKAGGLYIEQKIIKTGKLEDMSELELEKRMKEIIDQYSPILDAKPIEELKREIRTTTPSLKVVKESPSDIDDGKDSEDHTEKKEDKPQHTVVKEEKKYI